MEKGVIYRLVNRETGQCYVGQTTQGLNNRINRHKQSAKHIGTNNEGQPIVHAIREFGFEAFDVEVLYESELFDDMKALQKLLDEKEIYFIEKYDSLRNGYNRTKGGVGMLGFKPTEKTIKAIKAANTRRQLSEQHKEAVRKSSLKRWANEEYRTMMSKRFSGEGNPMYGVRLTGEKNPNFGKHMSDETKRKLSEAKRGKKGRPMSDELKRKLSELHKGKPKSESHRKKLSEAITGTKNPKLWKQILQYSLDGEFIKEWDSISEAQEACGTKHVSACAVGKRNNAGGFIWRYKTSEEVPQTVEVPKPKGNRPIAQIDENGVVIQKFATIREASKVLGLHYTGICAVLQGLQKKTGDNYRFVYIDHPYHNEDFVKTSEEAKDKT